MYNIAFIYVVKIHPSLFSNAHEAIVSGKTPDDIPKLDIRPLTTLVLAAVTGPLTGLCDLKMEAPSSKRCDSSEDSDDVDDDTTDEPKPHEGTSKGMVCLFFFFFF